MFFYLGKRAKIALSIFSVLLLYLLLTGFFDMAKLARAASWEALVACLPTLWFVKLPISLVLTWLCIWLNLNPRLEIKSRTVGDGQHGTARWATEKEKLHSFQQVPFGREREPGVVVGIEDRHWLVDLSDQNVKLLASPGGGKTKTMLVPTLYYNARVNKNTKGGGASFINTDCKGEELRTTGEMLKAHGYQVFYLDFRHPLQSYCFNLMVEVNRYMDLYRSDREETSRLIHYARAEKFAKMVSNAIIDNLGGGTEKNEASEYFKDTSQGLITSLILLVSEYGEEGERHILSVFKLIIELNGLADGSTDTLQKNKLLQLMEKIDNDRIKNFAGASITADVRTSMNIFSSALGKLLAFIDAELEQLVCRHSPEINDLDFVKRPTAIFLICPDEDKTRHFFASLFLRYFVTALITQAEEEGGELSRQVIALWDEMGQLPPVKDVDSIFTAFRSRRGRFLIALQSNAQLEKTYGRNMARIINEACQIQMFTGISSTAKDTLEELSKTLGSQTVQSGSVTIRPQDRGTASYQMVAKPLLSVTDIATLPKFDWVVQKMGCHPIRSHLPLYWDYLEKYPECTASQENHIIPIQTLNSDKVIKQEQRRHSKLTRGMFD